jgi:alkyl hydroperoxide reductase subunit AhpC
MPVTKKDYVASIYNAIPKGKSVEEVEAAIEEFQEEYDKAVNGMANWDFEQKGIKPKKTENKR